MRELNVSEVDAVSGAGYITINTGIVEIHTTYGEIQAGYDWAVEQATNFFIWWDPRGLLNESC
ncbi:MAG: hypothetical protein R3332_05035 [Pseudohongiellaceae bacterium]|nr:hypothetical protein [Pseudohongiellaceae bacterium]